MNESGAMRQMPRYKCHKEVWALKIAEIRGQSKTGVGAVIVPADEGFGPFFVDDHYLAKHAPRAGGYFIQYADGYLSFSPAEAFEDGYTKI